MAELLAMRLIWLVFLFCLAGVGASLTVPTVTIQGIVFGAQGPRAIVAGPNTTFLVQTGDLLGDYRVESIELEAVTFGFRELRFRMAVEPRAGRSRTVTPSNLRPRGPDDSIDLRLHGAELAYALKLLARVNEQPICCGPSVAGQVDMEVQEGSLDGTMEALAASGGQQLQVFEGILVAGDSATLGQKPWQIAGQEPATGLVSLDFVNADLIYVLYILAKELKLNAIIAPEVVGSFTITAKSLPTIRMIGLALWIQNQNYEARLDQNFLLVNTVMPEPGAAPTSNQPLLTVEPEMSLLSQPTKVREVPTRCGR